MILFSFFLQGSDKRMLTKLIQQHSKHPSFITVKSNAAQMFGIRHFAGSVYYNVVGESNQSTKWYW